jgi:hypothetical protein
VTATTPEFSGLSRFCKPPTRQWESGIDGGSKSRSQKLADLGHWKIEINDSVREYKEPLRHRKELASQKEEPLNPKMELHLHLQSGLGTKIPYYSAKVTSFSISK